MGVRRPCTSTCWGPTRWKAAWQKTPWEAAEQADHKQCVRKRLRTSWAELGKISPAGWRVVTLTLSTCEITSGCCFQTWVLQCKRYVALVEWVQWRLRVLEHLSYKDRLKDLGLFSEEKQREVKWREAKRRVAVVEATAGLTKEPQDPICWWASTEVWGYPPSYGKIPQSFASLCRLFLVGLLACHSLYPL